MESQYLNEEWETGGEERLETAARGPNRGDDNSSNILPSQFQGMPRNETFSLGSMNFYPGEL